MPVRSDRGRLALRAGFPNPLQVDRRDEDCCGTLGVRNRALTGARRCPAPSCLSMGGRRTGAECGLEARAPGYLTAQPKRADQGLVAAFVRYLQVIEQG